jgi:hypothetical protein
LEVEDLTFELAGRTILDGISLSIERGESPVRKMIGKDFPGTVKVLAAAGFQTIELCSPTNFAHPRTLLTQRICGFRLRNRRKIQRR